MNTTDQLNPESIRELIRATGPCITIALAANGTGNPEIGAKNAIATVREQLRSRGADAEEFLQPVSAALADVRDTLTAPGGIVILRSPSVMQTYRVSSIRPLVRVDDYFDVRTVLSVAADQIVFYVLALSQKRTRILKCTRGSSEEIPFPAGFPNNLADALQTRQPDHNLDNRASGGPSMGGGAVVFGTSSDRDDKDEYLQHFFSTIDKAVHAALKDSPYPLIPVAVEQEIALYRRVNTYPHLIEPGVHGAPDGLEGGEMHRRALELLEARTAEPGREVPADFDKRVGTGHASVHIKEIVVAAHEGRVSKLFFEPGAEYLGTYDPVRRAVKHTDDPLDSPVDLIEMAAYQTILARGEAKLLPAPAMPNGVPACALFRYPAVRTAAEAGATQEIAGG
jgi:hypothetical protein